MQHHKFILYVRLCRDWVYICLKIMFLVLVSPIWYLPSVVWICHLLVVAWLVFLLLLLILFFQLSG
jgi:hypothetical protein